MKSLKHWKMENLLREFSNEELVQQQSQNPPASSMGDNKLNQEITNIYRKNNEDPIRTLSDVMSSAFTIVGGAGSVNPEEVRDFIKKFISSQSIQ